MKKDEIIALMAERMADSFALMDEEERQDWSRDKAVEWVDDQRRYEKNRGLKVLPYDADEVYNTIAEMIQTELGVG